MNYGNVSVQKAFRNKPSAHRLWRILCSDKLWNLLPALTLELLMFNRYRKLHFIWEIWIPNSNFQCYLTHCLDATIHADRQRYDIDFDLSFDLKTGSRVKPSAHLK